MEIKLGTNVAGNDKAHMQPLKRMMFQKPFSLVLSYLRDFIIIQHFHMLKRLHIHRKTFVRPKFQEKQDFIMLMSFHNILTFSDALILKSNTVICHTGICENQIISHPIIHKYLHKLIARASGEPTSITPTSPGPTSGTAILDVSNPASCEIPIPNQISALNARHKTTNSYVLTPRLE
jgi:hypothetical protein